MLMRVSFVVLPALLVAAVCWDPTLRRRAARALGPLYVVSEPPELRPAPGPARYEPCVAGCCDDDPEFCALLDTQSPFGSMENACGYATVRSRCVRSCGRCDEPTDACEDEWPHCDVTKAESPEFCNLDAGAAKCRRTCGHCARPACADSLSMAHKCEDAKQDLRLCAKPTTPPAPSYADSCPLTCGQCSEPKVGLAELLRRQPCEDAPGCELSDDEVADATLAKFRNCEDIGFCGPTRAHPDAAALCSDPAHDFMYRDTLCRGTCGSCTPEPPLEPLPQRGAVGFLAAPRRAQGACSAVKARQCPKKCGVCKANGRRSVWQVDNLELIVQQSTGLKKP